MNADELIQKYNLKADSYELTKFSPTGELNEDVFFKASYAQNYLLRKWRDKIPDGWYGFDFGCNTPQVWYAVIEEFLQHVREKCPDFEIHQIKTKWGGIRIYLDKINDEIESEISKLESVLHDKKLIY